MYVLKYICAYKQKYVLGLIECMLTHVTSSFRLAMSVVTLCKQLTSSISSALANMQQVVFCLRSVCAIAHVSILKV